MAAMPLTEELAGPLILNVEGAGLSQDQFFRLCADNPELHLELTAQKESVLTGFVLDLSQIWSI
jgi:hypothetical protein